MCFMIPPFDSVMHKTAGGNFNLFRSSERTVIECTFGKVDLRWGNLWKRVGFTPTNNARVIDACLWLHNFNVDFHAEVENTTFPDRFIYDEDSQRFLATQAGIGGEESGMFGGEEEEKRDASGSKLVGGRPILCEQESRTAGREIWEKIRNKIQLPLWVRPPANYYQDNHRVLDN